MQIYFKNGKRHFVIGTTPATPKAEVKKPKAKKVTQFKKAANQSSRYHSALVTF